MKTCKKVLFVVTYLFGDEGISVGLARLGKGLIEQGWEVAIASAMTEVESSPNSSGRQGPSWFESQGIKHFYVPFPVEFIAKPKFGDAFKALLKLSQVVQEFKPQVINLHSLSLLPYLNFIRLRHGIPFVSTARIEPVLNRKSVKLSALLNKLINNFSGDRFIAISTEIQDIYQNFVNVPTERMRLVNHGVDETYFRLPTQSERQTARQEFNLGEKQIVACIIGRLDPVKGHNVLFKAVAKLKSQNINLSVLCAGGWGLFEDKIKSHTVELNISESVQFLGFIESRKVLWASDILVLPSLREGFGWVIVEAMLCGVVPIRTPSAGAIDQIQDGVNGFLIPFDDDDILSCRLKQLIESQESLSAMSESALNFAKQKFTSKLMIEKTIAVYMELIPN
jgi:glycosyltransferase involved in cell wall biosynthesis